MFLAGCSLTARGPDCNTPEDVLGNGGGAPLTCADADVVVDAIERAAARRVTETDRRLVRQAVLDRFEADPAGTRAALARVAEETAALAGGTGLSATEARADAVWRLLHGDPLLGVPDATVRSVAERTISPWATDTEARLVLSEMDVEGWIRYASLCREVQGGGPLRLSVADRVTVYRWLVERFQAADRPDQLAMLSVGPVWPSVRAAWASASYDDQQAWALDAPLPPPMTASSLGYVEALFETDLTSHALSLHTHFAPLTVGVVQ